MTQPQIGCTKDDLDTPALCIDLDVLDRNIKSMAETCSSHGVQWRPHCKCHKSPMIANKQIQAGAIGITCAKLGEAEVMAAGGIQDMLIANLIVGEKKLRRLVELCRQANPVVCVDHISQAEAFNRVMTEAGLQLRVILEVDIGLERVGVLPEKSVELAKQVVELPGLKFSGIMGYEGHLLRVQDPVEKREKIHAALDVLIGTRDAIAEAGIACEIVSCGGTGSYFISVEHDGITELQAGGGIFMDAFYRYGLNVPALEYAITVLTTVVSRGAPDRAIVDSGRKTVHTDFHEPLVKGRDDMTVEALSAEHGKLKLEESAQDLRIGDRLELVPGYVDFTSVLHDNFYVFQDDKLVDIWPIEGRGKLQ